MPSGPKASGVLFLEKMGLTGSYGVEKHHPRPKRSQQGEDTPGGTGDPKL